MQTWTCAVAIALLLGVITLTAARPPAAQPDKHKLPAPGTTGNPDNVPYIGKKDPQPGLFKRLAARQPPGASSTLVTELQARPASETHRPLNPTWGRDRNGLSNGSARRMEDRNRDGGTQALAHATIPLQVRPT
jgi:hypothetical protein